MFNFLYTVYQINEGCVEISTRSLLCEDFDTGLSMFMKDEERVCNQFTVHRFENGLRLSYEGVVDGYRYRLKRL